MAAHIKNLERFADTLRPDAPTKRQSALKARSKKLGLDLLPEEVVVYSALNEPKSVQEFIADNLPYNHVSSETRESCRSPRKTLIEGSAHCFEGALFALATNFLNKRRTKIVLLEAKEGYDHNLDVYQDPKTKMWGSIDECGYDSRGRKPVYKSVRSIAKSYSDQDATTTGGGFYRYSDPIDIVEKFGTEWITAPHSREIYYHYIDDEVNFHRIFGRDSDAGDKKYPLIVAITNQWIVANKHNRAEIAVENFPPEARTLWNRYLEVQDSGFMFDEEEKVTKRFFKITGVTPLALQEQAFDFNFYLKEGYKPEELLAGTKKSKK